MQIGAGLIRMSATHSLQIVSTEYFFLLKNFVLLQIYFYFPIFEKYNSKMEEFSSRIIHSGTSHCPGMDMAGTRDISFHSGTVPGNPGHLVTLYTMVKVYGGHHPRSLMVDCSISVHLDRLPPMSFPLDSSLSQTLVLFHVIYSTLLVL